MSRKVFLQLFLIITLTLATFVYLDYRSPDYKKQLQTFISAQRIASRLKILAARPHRAGTDSNHKVGDEIIRRLQEAGLKVWTEEFDASLPEPVESSLAITFPVFEPLTLTENVLPEDPYSETAQQEIPFFAFSPDADLEAEVVYVHYGDREDYEKLKELGIDVKGKIVLARAQGICRGMKQLLAEEHQAAGMLIYPELKDEGFVKPAFPQGTHVNFWTVQRGSLLKWFRYPGDPEKAPESTLPAVPSLPVSQAVAEKIFQKMLGPAPPPKWKGLLPVDYRLGPGPVKVRLKLTSQKKHRKLRNIFAEIEGGSEGDPYVMAGNHYDAWIYGASDPSSGTVVLLETAEALSLLVQKGWKPSRKIIFAFWDGEEYGFYGSTNTVVKKGVEFRDRLALYFNVDSGFRNRQLLLNVQPGLRSLIDAELPDIIDPQSGHSMADIRGTFRLPGYSGDTAPFLNLAGVPVAEVGFGQSYGVYHSVYDNLTWMNLADPGYAYHATLAELLASVLFQFTNEPVLPYRFLELADYFQDRFSSEVSADLREALETFRKAAENYDNTSKINIPPQNIPEVNKRLLKAFVAFSEPETQSFSESNLLQRPSPDEGCPAEPVPFLNERLKNALMKSTLEITRATKLLK